MRPSVDRRVFLGGTAAAAALSSATTTRKAPAAFTGRVAPVVVASANGHPRATRTAFEAITGGKPVVDAVVAGVSHVEADPEDHSVGLGGLPNERGIVELDASVMDGETCLSGAVASLQGIVHPSQVALRVMRYTDHCLLVGPGAAEFARAHGFRPTELLTDEARKIWLHWKATLSERDDWFPMPKHSLPAHVEKHFGITGTINCDGVDAKGKVAGVTTTSGLAFKIPGRVGDSPIIGAGLYVDPDAGAAGSTGRGEANIISCGSASVVMAMGAGKHPKDACLEACRRIARLTRAEHLTDEQGRPKFNVKFYAVDPKGRYGGAQLRGRGGAYAVCDASGPRLEKLATLIEI